MIKKLYIVMLCSAITQAHYLDQARDRYHNTLQYKKWQQFNKQNEVTLKQLDKNFFEAHNKCVKQNSSLIPRFRETEECTQAGKLSQQYAALSHKLEELEEEAANTLEGKEYFHLLQVFFNPVN